MAVTTAQIDGTEGGMTFAVVRLTSPDPRPDPHYPMPGVAPDSVRPEPDDGPVRPVRVSSIRVADVSDGQARTLTDLPEIRAQLYVTASRVALAASAGSVATMWPGAGRSARPMLAGHLRYTWLTSLHARSTGGWLAPNSLSIGFRDPVGPGFGSLTVTVTRQVPAAALARAIAALAARAQARAVGVTDAARAALTDFAADPQPETSDGFVRFTLPGT